MKKKHQRIFATILAVLISVAMVGSAIIGYFAGGGIPSADTSGSTQTNSLLADYQARKARIEALNQQVKSDPNNVQLQTSLGDEYYDAGLAAQAAAPSEVQGNFEHAVEVYQKVLKLKKDPGIMVDMATSAFYSGQNDLAEQTYKEALALAPDSYNALGNYGVFLAQVKKDWAGALTLWQKAQPLAKTDDDKERIKALINEAETQLKSNSTASGLTNPNPALKGGGGKTPTP